MNHSLKWLSLALTSVLVSACSTASKVTDINGLPALKDNASGVALSITLASDHPIVSSDGCTLYLWHVSSVKTYNVKIQPGSNLLFSELPPGIYGLREIYCSQKTWSFAFEKLPQFQVYEGKISLIGTSGFYVSNQLNFNYHNGNRTEDRRDTLAFLGRLSPENQKRVVSGFTGKPVDSSLLEPAGVPGKWDLKDDSGENVKKGSRTWPNFKSCFQGEWDVNHLWLGVLTVDVTTEDSNVTETKVEDTWNTYTDHFIDCVKSRLADFHPTLKTKLHYKLYL